MNKNLFLKEAKRNITALILWAVVICFLIILTMSFYRTFIENQSQVIGMMNLIPKGVLEMRGFANINELLTVLGYYTANNTINMMLLGSIYAIVLSSNILLKEEYNKTAEYLLSRPVTRSDVFLTKLSIIIMNIILLNFITDLAGYISLECFKIGEYNFHSYLILVFYTFLLNLLFGSIGLFISVLVKRSKPLTTLSIAIVLICYFIFSISKITPSGDKFGYICPFKFVNTNIAETAYGINFWHILYFAGISLILIVMSHFRYQRKDIYT